MQEVEAICDRLMIINNGKIIEDNSIQKIKQRAAGEIILISFKQNITSAFFSNIFSSEVIPLQGLPSCEWRIKTTDTEKTRKQLLQQSMEQKVDIVSLQNETDSL